MAGGIWPQTPEMDLKHMTKDINGFSKFATWLKGAKPEQIAFLKAVEPADLDNLTQIYTSLDNGGVETVPSAGEILTGAPIGAHGADADEQIRRHAELVAQEGRMKLYEELDGRMKGLEKAVGALVSLIQKANEDEIAANKDEDEDVSKSLRKARIAVRKAESCDDDDWTENMEKAEAAIKALNDIISKAEDDADSDEKEKAAEKARVDFATMKGKLKAIKTSKATPVVKAEDEAEAEAKKSQDAALAAFASSKGITVAEMLSRISSDHSTAPAPAPTFSKSSAVNVGTFIKRADDLRKTGGITDAELQRVESVVSKVNAMNAGLLAESVVVQSVTSLPHKLQNIFSPVAA